MAFQKWLQLCRFSAILTKIEDISVDDVFMRQHIENKGIIRTPFY